MGSLGGAARSGTRFVIDVHMDMWTTVGVTANTALNFSKTKRTPHDPKVQRQR